MLPFSPCSASCWVQRGAQCAFSRWLEEIFHCEQLAYMVDGVGKAVISSGEWATGVCEPWEFLTGVSLLQAKL